MEENAKSQDCGDKPLPISILKFDLTCFIIFFNIEVAGKYISVCKEYIWLFIFSIQLPTLLPIFI